MTDYDLTELKARFKKIVESAVEGYRAELERLAPQENLAVRSFEASRLVESDATRRHFERALSMLEGARRGEIPARDTLNFLVRGAVETCRTLAARIQGTPASMLVEVAEARAAERFLREVELNGYRIELGTRRTGK